MSNKNFAEKYDLPASSVSKIVYGNYPGKRFKDSPLRFMEVKKETIDKLKSRVRKCSKGYFHNPLLTNKEIIQVFVASKVPNLYINTVLILKRIRGVLCE